MKLVSWNVNGIRAALKKGFSDFLAQKSPDVVCLQEVKAERHQVEETFDGYHVYWHASSTKKGYSGTAILSKLEPLNVYYGFEGPVVMESNVTDEEGRIIVAEYEDFFVATVYTPNSGRDLARLEYRTKEWDKAFLEYMLGLEKRKPVVFCGDLNVAHKEIDLAKPKTNKKNAGFTPQERESFDHIVSSGFVDTFRYFHPEKTGAYSWWSYRFGARDKNIGWRLDYFCVSESLINELSSAGIWSDVKGSDHCPVFLEL